MSGKKHTGNYTGTIYSDGSISGGVPARWISVHTIFGQPELEERR